MRNAWTRTSSVAVAATGVRIAMSGMTPRALPSPLGRRMRAFGKLTSNPVAGSLNFSAAPYRGPLPTSDETGGAYSL